MNGDELVELKKKGGEVFQHHLQNRLLHIKEKSEINAMLSSICTRRKKRRSHNNEPWKNNEAWNGVEIKV